jgi:hypothetical protein
MHEKMMAAGTAFDEKTRPLKRPNHPLGVE